MSIYRQTRGLGVVALWAFAPAVVIQTDETTGELRFSVGAGVGEYARVVRGCSGEVLEADTFPFTALGLGAEIEGDQIRARVYGGRAAPDEDEPAAAPPASRGSGYFGGQVAYEGETFGLGLGAATYGGIQEDVLPSIHIRIGRRDGFSGILDIAPPTTMPGVTGLVRGGMAYRSAGGFGGLVGFQEVRPFDDNEGSGPFVELRYPMLDRLAVDLGGSVHFGSNGGPSDWGLGVGLTFTPWRR